MIRNENVIFRFLLFFSVLFCRIDTFSKCCDCCGCCGCSKNHGGGGSGSLWGFFVEKHHKFDEWPEGYFIIDLIDSEKSFYISKDDKKIYTSLTSYGGKQELDRANGKDSLEFMLSLLISGGVYYNKPFKWDDNESRTLNNFFVDFIQSGMQPYCIAEDLKKLSKLSFSIVFWDRTNTVRLVAENINLKITEDKVLICDNFGQKSYELGEKDPTCGLTEHKFHDLFSFSYCNFYEGRQDWVSGFNCLCLKCNIITNRLLAIESNPGTIKQKFLEWLDLFCSRVDKGLFSKMFIKLRDCDSNDADNALNFLGKEKEALFIPFEPTRFVLSVRGIVGFPCVAKPFYNTLKKNWGFS